MRILTFKGKSVKDAKKLSDHIKKGKNIVGVFADWCGACKMMKPEWEAFISECKRNHADKSWNICTVYHPMNELSKSSKCFKNVLGFPTIMCVDKDRVVSTFNKERVAKNFIEYCRENFGGEKKSDRLSEMVRRVTARIRSANRTRKRSNKKRKLL